MMLHRVRLSLERFNYKLFAALLVLGMAPSIYTSVRVFFLGQLPGDWAFSIAGQLAWVNLLYEVLNEALILPLFYFIGKVKDDAKEFSNRLCTGMLAAFGLYTLLAIFLFVFAEALLIFMAADMGIIEASASYIRLESAANVLSILVQFALVALVVVNKSKYLYMLTAAKLALCLVADMLFVSSLPISLQLGVNGIACSNIIVNVFFLALSTALLKKEGVRVFRKKELDFKWMRELGRIGGISGMESLVRNLAYMLMIVRMVNVVGEQGTYWVANNFIWGWLLLPVLQLGELIKQETAIDKANVRRNSLGYFAVTALICLLWLISVPLWRPFMTHVLGISDVEKVFSLVLLLVAFYVLYAFQNVFDSTFYGLGKTNYMLFESVVTNVIYYGAAFLLYAFGIWRPSLTGIALMFGFGNAFDAIVSLAAYRLLLKRQKISIWNAS